LVGAGVGAPRLVAVPFLAAVDLAAPARPAPAERRVVFPFDRVEPLVLADPLRVPEPAPRPPPPRPLAPLPALRPPDRLAVVRAPDPVPRPAARPAPAEPLRAPPDRAAAPEPRLAPRGGVLGRITSGDSSL
jgi:hypothetical protein